MSFAQHFSEHSTHLINPFNSPSSPMYKHYLRFFTDEKTEGEIKLIIQVKTAGNGETDT